MHLPEIDKYAHLDSPLHRWDTRVRLACLLLLMIAVVLAPTLHLALLGFAFALGLLLLSRIPVRFVLVHLRWVLLFCAFLCIVLPLSVGGDVLWRAGPLAVRREGLLRASLITVRAVAAVLLVFPMFGASPFPVTVQALQKLRVQSVLVQLTAFSYRYVFVLLDEMRRMLAAARSRGGRAAGRLRATRALSGVVGMLLVRSYDRTVGVWRAMVSRGYSGRMRTLHSFAVGRADVLKGAAVGAAAIVFLMAGIL